MPFDSGSRGGNCTILVANAPVNAATPTARRPMPRGDAATGVSR